MSYLVCVCDTLTCHLQTSYYPKIFGLFRALGLRHLVIVNRNNEVEYMLGHMYIIHLSSKFQCRRADFIFKCLIIKLYWKPIFVIIVK